MSIPFHAYVFLLIPKRIRPARWLLALTAFCLLTPASAEQRPFPVKGAKPALAAPAAPAPVAPPATTATAVPNDNVQAGVAALQRGHYAIAMRAWREDADRGNPLAQNNVGYLHEHGLGVPQSYVEAMSWYRKAAGQGQAQALFNIGTLYFYGYGVERNPREALTYFRQAANKNLPEGQYMLGVAFHEGIGTPADAALALDWFVKSALQGYVSAQMMAGLVYLSGDASGKIEADKAYIWADIATRGGNADAPLIRDYASYKLSRKEIQQAQEAAARCTQSRYRQCPAR